MRQHARDRFVRIDPLDLIFGRPVIGARLWAMLSVIGGAVCVAGAWLMRRAQIEPGTTT